MKWRASLAFLVLILASSGLSAQPGRSPDFEPLSASSLGSSNPPPPRTVTPPGSYALSIDGDFNLGGFVFKDGYPFLHNDGGSAHQNTALGLKRPGELDPRPALLF